MDNGVYYEEDEDGDRALPKADDKGKYHLNGKVELATQKQARSLVNNCELILEKVKENRKLLVTPGVRFYREPCCENAGGSGQNQGRCMGCMQGERDEKLQGGEPRGAVGHQGDDGGE